MALLREALRISLIGVVVFAACVLALMFAEWLASLILRWMK